MIATMTPRTCGVALSLISTMTMRIRSGRFPRITMVAIVVLKRLKRKSSTSSERGVINESKAQRRSQ